MNVLNVKCDIEIEFSEIGTARYQIDTWKVILIFFDKRQITNENLEIYYLSN